MKRTIDLSADVGEGFADEALLPYLTSVHIACGAHAGDAATMEQTAAAALARGLALGAHPGFPDREHFGRRELALAPEVLRASLLTQLSRLAAIVTRLGGRLVQVKPHGALYNQAARDPALAAALAAVVADFDPALRLVGLAGSQLLSAARAPGLATLAEGFVERRYLADGRLAPRSDPRAFITAPEEAARQALALAGEEPVPTLDGGALRLAVDSLCVHGDSNYAVPIARAIHAALAAAGFTLAAAGR